MNWLILIVAGLCEVGFSFCLGKAKGLSGLPWWEWIAGFAFFYVLSAVLLAKATESIPIGTAYPVWTGIGALGAVSPRNNCTKSSICKNLTFRGIPSSKIWYR